MMGLSGNGRSYEDFERQASPQMLPCLRRIREFCMSLGDNVIEDVRMHRVVFCKSMTFRWFADVQPEKDRILVKIQRGRNVPIQTIEMTDCTDLGTIREAYEKIR